MTLYSILGSYYNREKMTVAEAPSGSTGVLDNVRTTPIIYDQFPVEPLKKIPRNVQFKSDTHPLAVSLKMFALDCDMSFKKLAEEDRPHLILKDQNDALYPDKLYDSSAELLKRVWPNQGRYEPLHFAAGEINKFRAGLGGQHGQHLELGYASTGRFLILYGTHATIPLGPKGTQHEITPNHPDQVPYWEAALIIDAGIMKSVMMTRGGGHLRVGSSEHGGVKVTIGKFKELPGETRPTKRIGHDDYEGMKPEIMKLLDKHMPKDVS